MTNDLVEKRNSDDTAYTGPDGKFRMFAAARIIANTMESAIARMLSCGAAWALIKFMLHLSREPAPSPACSAVAWQCDKQ
jgi:hypothetical protein